MLKTIIGGASNIEASLISSTMAKSYGEGVVEEKVYSLEEPRLKVDVRMAMRDLEVVAVFLGKGYQSLESLISGYSSKNLYCYSDVNELKGILNKNFGMDFEIESQEENTPTIEPIKDPEFAIFQGWMASYNLSFKDIIAKFDGIRAIEKAFEDSQNRILDLESKVNTSEIAEDISSSITLVQEGVSNEDYSALESRIKELTKEKKELTKEKEDLVLRLQNKVEENNNLTSLNLAQKNRIIELSTSESNEEDLKTQIENLKTQIETQKEIFQGKLTNLQEERNLYFNKYKNLEDKQESDESLKLSISDKDTQIESLKQELEEAKNKVTQFEELQNKVTSLNEDISNLNFDLESKNNEVELLRAEKQDLADKLNNIDLSETDELKNTIQNLGKSNETLSQDNSNLRRDITELNRRLLSSSGEGTLDISSNFRKVLEGVSLDTKYYRIFSMPSYTDKLEFVFAGSHKSMSFMYKMVEEKIKASGENTLVVDLSAETYLDYYFSMGKVTNVANYLDGKRLASNFKEMFVGSSTLKAMGTAWAWGGYNNFAMYDFEWSSILEDYLSLGFKVVVIGGSLGDSFSRSLLASVSGVFDPTIYTESFSLALRSTMYNLGIVGGSITSKIVSGKPKSSISKAILASLERKGYSLEVIDD